MPGKIDGGFSRIGPDELANASYEVKVVRLDDLLKFSGRRLAIKIDVEYYECKVLAGIRRILRQNECIVQIETFDQLDQVAAMMAAVGYDLVASFLPNFVFKNARVLNARRTSAALYQ